MAPRTVHNIILDRVDRLPRRAKSMPSRLLQCADGVLPPHSLPTSLANQAMRFGRPWTRSSKATSSNAAATKTAETCAFTHALVRDALYSSLLSVDRSELHARVGKWLEHRSSESDNDAAIPELAFHYSRSGEDAKAVLYLKAAGRAALGTYSIDDASRAYREAIARG